MAHFVYGLIDPRNDELKYVGETKDMEKRLETHQKDGQLRAHTKKNNWLKSLKKKGLAPEMIKLEEYETEKEAFQAEIDLIAYYKYIGCDLTNGTEGGEGGIPNEEVKQKISQTLKEYYITHDNPNLGKKLSEDTKEKISQSLTGRYVGEKSAMFGRTMPDEVKQKISETKTGVPSPLKGTERPEFSGENHPLFGTHLSDEIKQYLSEINTGKIMPEETKIKISEANKGRPSPFKGQQIHSEETKKIIGEASRGRIMSEETKKKLSESKSGENHPMFGKTLPEEWLNNLRSFSMDTISEIRNKYNYGTETITHIADEYNISNGFASLIINNETYFDPNYTRTRQYEALKGENHPSFGIRPPSAKLTFEIAEQIRQMYKNGIKAKDLANQFAISKRSLSDLLNYKSYKS